MFKQKLVIGSILSTLFLTACTTGTGTTQTFDNNSSSTSFFKEDIDNFISSSYSLLDVVSGENNPSMTEYIYLATNATIEEVSSELQAHERPYEVSEIKNDKQILVYDNHFVTLTKYAEDDSSVQIQLATKEFVRRNYAPGFFEGYLLASLLDDVFDSRWRKNRSNECRKNPEGCYTGYSGTTGAGGSFRSANPSTQPPSIRGNQNRGGGPGAGK
ncbi:DUF4247 domain-containing protein [Mangrovibacillus cuniculi]|uniref:DUF4247 domain-containing protein n=1 Tax=Mangrovibacillus cuniculi TaxID=2593652 RepID=A0A7S8CDE8_9BACI|nr:DUF4247 domain-containing protein [Mangrovibacillus cuniculi]QPC47801.1 DUF4247 domain-containing protein [Mangrovibacillus cuniculi]